MTGNWILYALLSAAFGALTAILAKVGISGTDSDLGTAIRSVIILVAAWMIVLARGKAGGLAALSQRNWIFLVLSGLATAASWIFYFRALQLGPAARVSGIDKLSVGWVALLSVAFLGEASSVRLWSGITLIVAGTLLLSSK